MNSRDKIMLAGAAVILVGLATTAALTQEDAPEAAEIAEVPVGSLDRTDVTTEDALLGTRRLMNKAPKPGEIPEDIKEAENYLNDRWGHMGDAGLLAPGVMPEGDQYFVDKKIVSGVRGNGKPIYAKTYIRAHRFVGPVMNAGAGEAGVEHLPELQVDTSEYGGMKAKAKRVMRKTDTGMDKGVGSLPKADVTSKLSGSGYSPRPKPQSSTATPKEDGIK